MYLSDNSLENIKEIPSSADFYNIFRKEFYVCCFFKLLNEKGLKTSAVARATGISNMTFSDWKNGKSTPKADKLSKIADYFGVSVDYLMTGKEDLISKKTISTAEYERDIEKILSKTKEQLLSQDGLMFNKYPAMPESIDAILSAMEIGMEMANKNNKELHMPDKYKKD